MRSKDLGQFLTVSLLLNLFIAAFLIWQWGTGGRIIFVQPHFSTFAKLVPYALALACVYFGFTAWIYFMMAYAVDRWPSTKELGRWLVPTGVSARFIFIYVVSLILLVALGVPYVSGRAHIIRSFVAELGFAGQVIAIFGTIASLFGFLRLFGEDNLKGGVS